MIDGMKDNQIWAASLVISTGSTPAMFVGTYSGGLLAGSSATNSAGSVNVAFGQTFTSVPNVALGCQDTTGVAIDSVSTTAFWASGTASKTFHWIAVGPI